MPFSFPLFDHNGLVITLKSFRGGRDTGDRLSQPLDSAGEMTEAEGLMTVPCCVNWVGGPPGRLVLDAWEDALG